MTHKMPQLVLFLLLVTNLSLRFAETVATSFDAVEHWLVEETWRVLPNEVRTQVFEEYFLSLFEFVRRVSHVAQVAVFVQLVIVAGPCHLVHCWEEWLLLSSYRSG